ncbi:MAG: ZIP family metal transporter [Peptococcales bacterium]|jgi:ZIP family zinc transporter
MLSILFYSLLAGLATLLGCMVVLAFGRPNEKLLAWMLGLAAGIMLTVVIIDLIPSSFIYSNLIVAMIGFLLGNLLLLILDLAISTLPAIRRMQESKRGHFLKMGYLIAIGIALHDLPEGIAIAAGYSATDELGLIIALAIGLHNIPEGMAAAAPLKMGGMGNLAIIILITLVSTITPLGAFIGLLLVSISKSFIALLLAMAGGAMTYIVKSELWPESQRRHPNYARLGAFCGVVIMLSVGLIH